MLATKIASPKLKSAKPVDADILWLARTSNVKTGDVPTAYVGKTMHQALKSCRGCNLLKNKDCYAWFGTPGWALNGILRAYQKDPQRYSFLNALANRAPTSRMVRMSAIGDPARAKRRSLLNAWRLAKQLKLAFVGYTHFHSDKDNRDLKKILMASCDTTADADSAVERGWRATTIVPYNFKGKRFITPAGNHAVVCPAQTVEKITCNDCLLCDASKTSRFKIVAFKDHGPKVRNQIRAMKKLPSAN